MMYDTDIFLILKRLDAFEENLKKLEQEIEILNSFVDTQLKNKYYGEAGGGMSYLSLSKGRNKISCYFDNLSPEDKMKPMSISCPCPKCSPYSLSQGSLVDSGTTQEWRVARSTDGVEE